MDKVEAKELLAQQIERLRGLSYEELLAWLDRTETIKVVAASGAEYQVQVQVLWDDRPGDSLRVIASIDDGGVRALAPLGDDFIIASDGSFVGE